MTNHSQETKSLYPDVIGASPEQTTHTERMGVQQVLVICQDLIEKISPLIPSEIAKTLIGLLPEITIALETLDSHISNLSELSPANRLTIALLVLGECFVLKDMSHDRNVSSRILRELLCEEKAEEMRYSPEEERLKNCIQRVTMAAIWSDEKYVSQPVELTQELATALDEHLLKLAVDGVVILPVTLKEMLHFQTTYYQQSFPSEEDQQDEDVYFGAYFYENLNLVVLPKDSSRMIVAHEKLHKKYPGLRFGINKNFGRILDESAVEYLATVEVDGAYNLQNYLSSNLGNSLVEIGIWEDMCQKIEGFREACINLLKSDSEESALVFIEKLLSKLSLSEVRTLFRYTHQNTHTDVFLDLRTIMGQAALRQMYKKLGCEDQIIEKIV